MQHVPVAGCRKVRLQPTGRQRDVIGVDGTRHFLGGATIVRGLDREVNSLAGDVQTLKIVRFRVCIGTFLPF